MIVVFISEKKFDFKWVLDNVFIHIFFDTTIKIHVCHRVYFWNYLNYFYNGSSNSGNAYTINVIFLLYLYFIFIRLYTLHILQKAKIKNDKTLYFFLFCCLTVKQYLAFAVGWEIRGKTMFEKILHYENSNLKNTLFTYYAETWKK